jgi:hypothetical protein
LLFVFDFCKGYIFIARIIHWILGKVLAYIDSTEKTLLHNLNITDLSDKTKEPRVTACKSLQ